MKKNSFFVVALGLLASLAGCKGANHKDGQTVADTLAVSTDSVVVRDSLGHFRYVAQVPQGNPLLQRLVSEWMAEKLGGYYTGSYDSITPVLRQAADSAVAYARQNFAELNDEIKKYNAESSTSDYQFKKVAEGKDYVTWTYSGYTYVQGAAHGIAPFYGQTFRKSDGRRIGWEVVRQDYNEGLQQLMRKGLKEYLNVKTDDELKEAFLNENDFYVIPFPQCPPVFTKEGIEFVYNQYEITPYALGLPSFTLSYKDLWPYLTHTARMLVGE